MRDSELFRLPVQYDARAGVLPAWDPEGARLAVVARDGLVVLPLRAPAERAPVPRERVRAVAWSPAGDTLAIACDERDLQRLHRVDDGAEIWQSAIGETAVDEVLWSPDARHLAFVGEEIVVCDAATGAPRWRRGETRRQECVFPAEAQWSPDSRYLAARWGAAYRVLDAQDGEVKAEGRLSEGVLRWTSWGNGLFEDGPSRLARCASHIVDRWAGTTVFSRDGRFAAAEGEQHRLWIQDEHGARSLPGHPRTIKALAWSPQNTLATACRDGLIRKLQRPDANLEEWAHLDAEYGGLSWSPDGKYLAVCCGDSVVVLSIGDV